MTWVGQKILIREVTYCLYDRILRKSESFSRQLKALLKYKVHEQLNTDHDLKRRFFKSTSFWAMVWKEFVMQGGQLATVALWLKIVKHDPDIISFYSVNTKGIDLLPPFQRYCDAMLKFLHWFQRPKEHVLLDDNSIMECVWYPAPKLSYDMMGKL